MSYAILISGKVNETTTEQVIIANHKGTNYQWSRTTNGGRGESNAWASKSATSLSYPIIGEVLSTPLTEVDTTAINNGEIPNVLIQKLTKQYRLRHSNTDVTRTMNDVVDEVEQLIAQDPSLLAKFRSDGRSDKSITTTTRTEGKITMSQSTSPIVVTPIVTDERQEQSTLSFIPSLTNEAVRTYVPRKFNGLTEDEIYTYALKSKKNVSIQGHAGTGKTTSLMTFSAKHGLEFGSMSCNAGVEPSQFFGRLVPNEEGKLEWRDGLFTHFFRHGGVLVIDEANFLPQKIGSVLHGALDDRRLLTLLDHEGEVIHAHPNLLIAMCFNDGYKGTSKFNEAFADRFWIKLNFEYDTEIEKKFIPSATLLEIAKSMRNDSIAGVYETPVSTRLLKQFVDLAKNLSYDFAVENFVNSFKNDERGSIKLLMDSQRHNLELELTGKVSE